LAAVNVSINKQGDKLSDVSLANVEALAVEDSDCHYINGYSEFKSGTSHAYDCCLQWRDGKPKGVCL
jgi:hypothetical protein